MRRLRLQGQNERLLREAVRGIVNESDSVTDTIMAGVDWATGSPPVLDTLGRVFYPAEGFSTRDPFLVVARKSTARSDETASAYLLMFEKPPWSVVEDISRLWFPPGVVILSDVNDIKDILSGTKPGWEVTPALKRSVVFLRAQNNPSQFMIVQEIPAGNEQFLRLAAGRRRGIDLLEREAYKRAGKSGHQKIWRFFGEAAQHTWADAFITLASAAADFGGAAAEVAEPLQGIGAVAREPRLVALLSTIKAGDKLFSLASIALAGTIAADSKTDYDRVKASKNLSLNPNIDAAIEFYKNRTVMDAVNYALSMLAAAAELLAPSGTGASAAEISLLALKAGLTAYNAKGVYESANEFFKNNIMPKLKEAKNVLIRAFDAINASPEFAKLSEVLRAAVDMGKEFVTQL